MTPISVKCAGSRQRDFALRNDPGALRSPRAPFAAGAQGSAFFTEGTQEESRIAAAAGDPAKDWV